MHRSFGYAVLGVLVVLLAGAAPCAAAEPERGLQLAAGQEAAVAKIQAFREAGERKLLDHKFTRREVDLGGTGIKPAIRQRWAKLDAYYEGDVLVRLQLYPHAGSQRTEEFYLIDGKLAFAFIQDQGPKHEGRDMGEAGKELYFVEDKLVRYDDRSGEPETNLDQEKRMYETRLPYEVSELLEILKRK